MKMPWGKYKDQDLEDIPTDYLQWAAESGFGSTKLQEEIQNQLTLREGIGVVRKPQQEEF